MDTIKELAWPVALIAIALFFYLSILRLTKRGSLLNLKFKDWVEVSQGNSPASAEPVPVPASVAGEIPATESLPETTSAPPAREDKRATFFTLAKTVDEVDSLFAEFKTEPSYVANQEFWETYYVSHRASIAKVDEQAALEALAQANPSWVWPLSDLYHRHMRLHEFDEAEAALEQALARNNPQHHAHALRLAVDFRFQTKGLESALEFVRGTLAERLADKDAAAVLAAIADAASDDKDPFSVAIIRELSFLRDSDRKSETFDLAYALAETQRYRTRAYALYQRLFWDDERPHVRNNMGVIIGDIDAANQRELYEDSAAKGSQVAIGNLVSALVRAGFIRRAETFLLESGKASETQDPHIASALETIASAKKEASENKDQFDKRITSEDRQYREALTSALKSFVQRGFNVQDGTYVGPNATVNVSSGSVQVEVTDGTSSFRGSLTKKVLCFEGLLEEKGTTLLNSRFRGGVILQLGENELRLIVWPQEVSASPVHITLGPAPSSQEDGELSD